MPNWCDTTYKCVGDKKELRALKRVLDANNKRKTPRVPNGFGTMWIGNIIDHLGYDWEKYRCRGEITDYDFDGSILTIYQNTAWCEQEGFREVIEEKFPSIRVYYQEMEPGCELYYSNDWSGDYFPERYFLDSDIDWMFWDNIEEAADYCSDIVGFKVEPTVQAITDALEKYQEEQEEDCFFSFHEFTVGN